jgi:hypothetical protein
MPAIALTAVLCVSPSLARSTSAPSMVLDPSSPTLVTIGAVAGELLSPGVPPSPGPLPDPIRSLSLSALGLVSGDVPGALSFGFDAIPIVDIDGDSFFYIEAGVRLDADGNPLSPGLLGTVQTLEPGVVPFGFTNPVLVDRNGDGYVPPGLP